MSLPKYYKMLGLSTKNPSDDELKKAYKKAALKYHPDRNPNDKENAEKKFKEIAEAYTTLSDKNKKHIYDTMGEEGLKNGGINPNFNSGNMHNSSDNMFNKNGSFTYTSYSNSNINPHDIFKEMFNDDFANLFNTSSNFGNPSNFNFGNPSNFINKSKELEYKLYCNLEELYNGASKKIKIKRTNHLTSQITEKIFNIDVKPGWKDGTKITFKNEGDISISGEKQDIVIIIKEKTHNWFKRNNTNLIHDINITKKQQDKDLKITIPMLDKTKLDFTVNKDINKNKWIFENKGMPIRKKSKILGYGDLIVNLKAT